MRDENYLDAKTFSKMFRQRWANYEDICLNLNNICRGILGGRTPIADEDLIQDAVLKCIQQIPTFKIKNPQGKNNNAFSYFTTVAHHAIYASHNRKTKTKEHDEVFAKAYGEKHGYY